MRKVPALIAAFAALLLSMHGCAAASASLPPVPPYEKGLDSITVERSRMYVGTLAADSLEGRRAGTPGAVAASERIALWLEEADTVPLSGDSYFRTFDAGQVGGLGISRRLPPGLEVRNVLGKIEGTNPGEYVFVGAHYDHVGARSGGQGDDRIFNGADDNASGVAAVLQVARAFAASGEKPRRTVVFALWDAEEMGLVGSDCFVRTFAHTDSIRAYFNMDMIGRDESGSGGQVAYYSTDTLPYARFAAEDVAAYGLGVEPVTDADLLGRYFQPMIFKAGVSTGLYTLKGRVVESRGGVILPGNSDYAPFKKAGVPVYMVSTGAHPDYHRPGDEAHKIDYPKMTGISKMVFLMVYRLANPDVEIVYPANDTE